MAHTGTTVVALLVFLSFVVCSWSLVDPKHPQHYLPFEPEIVVRHRLFNEANGETIAKPGQATAGAISVVRRFCGQQSEWVITDTYTTKHNGITHVYLRQTYNGIEIANSPANVNFDKHGRPLNLGEVCFDTSKLKGLSMEPTLSPVGAVLAFASHLRLTKQVNSHTLQQTQSTDASGKLVYTVVGSGIGEDDEIPVKSSLIQTSGGKDLRLTWHVNVRLTNNWFDAHVCAHSGEVLYMADWVNWDSYEVYGIPNENPLLGSRVVEENPADLSASPKGWLDQGLGPSTVFTTNVGNNVYAQLNPTGGSGWMYNYRASGNVARNFRFPVDFFASPYEYRDAALSNLFYWNNVMHDIFYLRGFTEEAGNFQENNFDRGGSGMDAVQANAQDGAGFNNANFATPPDGSRPRMRMYLWNHATPYIDGDFDSGIIVHEYAHGITHRLTGGPSNVNCLGPGQPGGMGEGWGDCWAINFMQTPEYKPSDAFPMGNYAAGRGIRPYPYSADFNIDPQTYGFINKPGYNNDSNVHAKGSVWCTILHEVYWVLVGKHGFDSDWYTGTGGNNVLLQNVVDGLKLQPCRPTFVDARDAIILADKQNYDGKHVCDLWEGFARRGLGYKAVGTTKPVEENFDLPPECSQ